MGASVISPAPCPSNLPQALLGVSSVGIQGPSVRRTLITRISCCPLLVVRLSALLVRVEDSLAKSCELSEGRNHVGFIFHDPKKGWQIPKHKRRWGNI